MGAYGNTPYASKSAPAGLGGAAVVAASANSTASGVAQIMLTLASAGSVQVRVTNVAGREIAILQPQDLPQGISTLLWNGKSSAGTKAPAGQYLIRVTASGQDGSQSQALVGLSLAR